MSIKKVWEGTIDGDYNTTGNWRKVSIRNAGYQWTLGSGGTGEYYVELAGGGNPGLRAAGVPVFANGVQLTESIVGTLAPGEWAWSDNDPGFDTIYVRLSDSTDPDTKPEGYVEFQDKPQDGHDVVIPGSTDQDITTGLDQSSIAVSGFRVEAGFSKLIASDDEYLRLQCTDFEFAGSGKAFIDLTSSAVSPRIIDTATNGSVDSPNLYLKGTSLNTLSIRSGAVALAGLPNDATTVTTVQMQGSGAALLIGEGATLTTLNMLAGTAKLLGTCPTIEVYSGTLVTEGDVAVTTLTVHGGEHQFNASGTITTLTVNGGTADFARSGIARTVTNLQVNPGGSVLYDPDVLTVTNHVEPDHPIKVTTELAI